LLLVLVDPKMAVEVEAEEEVDVNADLAENPLAVVAIFWSSHK